jgi:uncharacterized protein (TIGR01244 family)
MKFMQFSRLLLAALVVGGCSKPATVPAGGERAAAPAATTASAPPNGPAELCEAQLGETAPVHAEGNIFLAGQPGADDLVVLADRGIKTVVSLRKPEEVEWDEAAAVRAAGMEFVAVPFDGAEELTDEVFDQVRTVLKDKSDEPLVLHCGRANRVGAVWLAHRVLDDGVGIDAALEEAKTVGLRTPEYIDRAKDYITRQQEGAAEPAK